nr:MAG TPA: hypothetical protein [Caudoviricetes sp.]
MLSKSLQNLKNMLQKKTPLHTRYLILPCQL